jgi:nitrite reductase/ring-hydroxylating ferredoxin subunit
MEIPGQISAEIDKRHHPRRRYDGSHGSLRGSEHPAVALDALFAAEALGTTPTKFQHTPRRHLGEEEVLHVMSGEKIFAVGAHCTRYHALLIDGLVECSVLHCPWHHAVFDLATGEALGAPAFTQRSYWEVERGDDKIFVRKRRDPVARASKVVRRQNPPLAAELLAVQNAYALPEGPNRSS